MRVLCCAAGEIRDAQLLFRFVIGGLIVSFFAALADVLKPKMFAGSWAAPSR
jgi:hypothetical protein